jgi:pimeloyl-ACP methyl ester carboxylesterase
MTTSAHLDLHVEVIGTGPTLVLLPPVGLRAWVWRPVAARLARQRTVVAVDLPGYGSPSLPAGSPWTVDRFTDAVANFLGARWPDPIEVAGVSLGGAIALELARRNSVRHAVAVSPIGFWSRNEARFAVASLRVTQRVARLSRPVRWRLARSPIARALLLAQIVGRPGNVPAEAVADMARDVADAPFAATLPHTGRYRFTPSADIGRRVTVAWGTRDRLLPPRQARRAHGALPAAQHVELPGAGHVPFWDIPLQLAALILDPAGYILRTGG